jgi:hypothetical protein
VFLVLFSGCCPRSNINDFGEESMIEYYQKEDFQSIIIGESTFLDVYIVAPTESMQVTSYGGFCEYPMEDGGYVRIKFYGEDLIVGAIEEYSLPRETD